MRILVVSSFVPFVNGGGRFIVEWLQQKLIEHGHQVEKFYLPSDDSYPNLFSNLLSYRLLDLTGHADRLIAIRPPSHCIQHPNKVVWFIHHIRSYYDLADSPYGGAPNSADGRATKDALWRHDATALREARAVFTNSKVVGERLHRFNGVCSKVLYPPLLQPDSFYRGEANDEIVSICRLERHKRQDLLIRAMQFVKTPVKLRIAGASATPAFERTLKELVADLRLGEKVHLEIGWIDEQRKIDLLSNCLASVYAPLDEDSYGYPTLEAAAASRPTLTTIDAGGTLEFVRDGENGLVSEATPEALAESFDRMFSDKQWSARMGLAADTVKELKITWDHVVDSLLA